ncbi:MAG TPA: tetraacyldisaccharide 4'-kinase [Fimbriimonadales bacterium]|nr:tetraacyldisaccharide 4'-kinase [Fimbriimonadales bacterium]
MNWERIFYPNTTTEKVVSNALLPLSWIYAAGWKTYEKLYQFRILHPKRFSIAILCVGSLEAGGSGKTPMTIALAKILQKEGSRVAVSCSGYKSSFAKGANTAPFTKNLDPEKYGDEASLIRRKLPEVGLIVGSDRVRAAELAETLDYRILILDDGFQHLRLHRNINLLMWTESTKKSRCLPAGPLREPISGIHRADALIVPENCSHGFDGINKTTFTFEKRFPAVRNLSTNEIIEVNWLKDRNVNAACAIGKPTQFFETLEALGAHVERKIVRGDHAWLETLTESTLPYVVTEKDAVKLEKHHLPRCGVYALEMEMKFNDEENLTKWLRERINL